MATENFFAKYKKATIILSTVAALGGAITASNVIFGVNIRPAWAWETEKLESDFNAELASLNVKQLRLQIKQLRGDRREYNRDLAKYRLMAEEYRKQGESVPGWLVQEIADTESDITNLDEEKGAAQKKILQLEGN